MKPNILLTLSAFTLMACSQGNGPDIDSSLAAKNTDKGVTSPNEVKVKAVVIAKNSVEDSLIKRSISEGKMAKGLLSGELDASVDNGLLVSFKITNNQSYGVPIQYRSGMTADLLLLDPMGNKIWAWSNEMMFTQAIRDTVIPVDKPITVKFKIPQKTMNQVKGSGYTLKAIYAGHATESKDVAMGDVTLSLNSLMK
jgi:hypothetical protein